MTADELIDQTAALLDLLFGGGGGAVLADDVDFVVFRGTTWTIPFVELGDLTGYERIYFTGRNHGHTPDSKSLCQLRLTDPSIGDGLMIFEGDDATANEGEITIDDLDSGDLTVSVAASTTKLATPGRYLYDIKVIGPGGVELKSIGGAFRVGQDITRAVQ
jgi:hypothetical protein